MAETEAAWLGNKSLRPTWDQYFLGIAEAVAARSDCERSKVGAVIVSPDRRIRATGYNGAPAAMPGCGSCPRRLADAVPGESSYDEGATRCVAVHAEANALLYCDRADLAGASLYITRGPCYACQKLIEAAGITNVIWPEKLRYAKPEQVTIANTEFTPDDFRRAQEEMARKVRIINSFAL